MTSCVTSLPVGEETSTAVPSQGQWKAVPPSRQWTSLQLALIASRQDGREEGTRNWPGKMIPNPSSPASAHSFSVGLSSPGPLVPVRAPLTQQSRAGALLTVQEAQALTGSLGPVFLSVFPTRRAFRHTTQTNTCWRSGND